MFDKILDVKIMGLSIPVYLVLAVIVLFAAQTEILSTNMVGALTVMIVLRSVFNLLGSKIPIVRSYLGGVAGMLTGRGFNDSILYIAMPMMSGGMGAGVTPLSEIYANATGLEQAGIISQMIPASAIGNVLAIISAALIAKIGTQFPALNGNGKLMDMPEEKKKETANGKMDLSIMGTGLLFSCGFFTIGTLISHVFPNVHAYAFMIIVVVIFKLLGVIPEKYEYMAVQWGQFVMKNFTYALLAGIGVALLDMKVLGKALTSPYFPPQTAWNSSHSHRWQPDLAEHSC